MSSDATRVILSLLIGVMLALEAWDLLCLKFSLIWHSFSATPCVLLVLLFIAYLITEGKGKKPKAWSGGSRKGEKKNGYLSILSPKIRDGEGCTSMREHVVQYCITLFKNCKLRFDFASQIIMS